MGESSLSQNGTGVVYNGIATGNHYIHNIYIGSGANYQFISLIPQSIPTITLVVEA